MVGAHFTSSPGVASAADCSHLGTERHAYHAVENHILGYTLQRLSFAVDMDKLDELGERFLDELPADEYPDLAVHVRQHTEEPVAVEEAEFEFGLRLILDGIERLHHSMSV